MDRAATLRLAKLLRDELKRAKAKMRVPNHPRAYYLSYLARHEEIWMLDGKYGALTADMHQQRRDCLADVRVGSYRHDQIQEGALHDNNREDESFEYVEMPFAGDEDGMRHALWRLTEARYRESLDAFLRKRSVELTYQDANPHLSAFQRMKGIEDIRYTKFPEIDMDGWRNYVQRASAELKKYPRVKNGSVKFTARNNTRIFANSEGALEIQCTPYWSVDIYLWYLSQDGDSLPLGRTVFVTDPAELPSLRDAKRIIKGLHDSLGALAKAPALRSFSGPALLDPKPAGLLVHEALGHRLEGNRLLAPGEGQTFRDSVGAQILPEGVDVYDDPRMDRFEGQSLVGSYQYDDEGTEAQRADLIVDGHLKGFLTSRTPVAKRHHSNGHGRSRYHARPMSRMAVTVMEAEDGLEDHEMKLAFLEEIERQGAPYGIRIIRASGGETSTESYNFQAFLGQIDFAARVYPDGREELVRGVDFVGTPLNAIRGIIAAGRRREVDNAFCGAESGDLPVSTVTPALLLAELELQNKPARTYTQYAYPMPWEK